MPSISATSRLRQMLAASVCMPSHSSKAMVPAPKKPPALNMP